ncbi:hypothetical protein B0H94_10713 [Salsuginibacillus halophilus]|uniref:DUF2157 domain-containing protein n=1 Tax=Salsuginibacillus halophilus TaxID=517424 RepID=A0A2P8HFK8_9BACI|nr:hypothetical protein [Salsuginibacillus halophilus]PSL45009.1 hypothetical protein B0H94_10713 [Salsuginibacillus halophilus]
MAQDQDRKDIIIQEIQYWKKHQLLPAAYCDFLLMLYTEGETSEETASSRSFFIERLKQIWAATFVLSAFFLLLVMFYFTEISFLLQMLTAFLFITGTLYLSYRMKARVDLLRHIFIFAGALMLFLTTTQMADVYGGDGSLPVILTVFMNCAGWLAAGVYWRLKYLTIAGAAGVVLMAGFFIIW